MKTFLLSKNLAGWACFIFVAALAVRLIYLGQLMQNFPSYGVPQSDSKYYHEWALNMAQGKPTYMDQSFFFLSPGYPFILSRIYKYIGDSLRTVSIIQMIVGSITCVLTFLIARTIAGNVAGLISGLIAAFYAPSYFYEGFPLSISWITFFNLLAIYIMIVCRANVFGLILSGMIWSLSYQLRPNVVLMVALGCLWLLIELNSSESGLRFSLSAKRFEYVLPFVVGFLTIIGVRMIVSYHVTGKLNPATATFGVNLFIGNNPNSSGGSDFREAFGKGITSTTMYQDIKSIAENDLKGNLTPEEVNTYYIQKAFGFIRSHPIQWTRLLVKKSVRFFRNEEIPSNYSFDLVREFVPLLKFDPINFAFIGALGLVGIAFFFSSDFILPSFYLLSYFLSCLILFVAGEYRYPIAPFLIIFASIALVSLFKKMKDREFSGKYYFALVLAGGFFMLSTLHNDTPAKKAQFHYFMGFNFLTAKQYEKALEEYKKSIELAPSDLAFADSAKILFERGQYTDALNDYEMAHKYGLSNANYHLNMARTFLALKKPQEAVSHYLSAFNEPLPIDEKRIATFNLGIAYYQNHKDSYAICTFKDYLRIEVDPAKIEYAKQILKQIGG